MKNAREQALLDARRSLAAMSLEDLISDCLEAGVDLSQIYCLDFDPMEAGYAS